MKKTLIVLLILISALSYGQDCDTCLVNIGRQHGGNNQEYAPIIDTINPYHLFYSRKSQSGIWRSRDTNAMFTSIFALDGTKLIRLGRTGYESYDGFHWKNNCLYDFDISNGYYYYIATWMDDHFEYVQNGISTIEYEKIDNNQLTQNEVGILKPQPSSRVSWGYRKKVFEEGGCHVSEGDGLIIKDE